MSSDGLTHTERAEIDRERMQRYAAKTPEVEDMTYDELVTLPPTPREVIGEKLARAMMDAVKKVLTKEGLTAKQLYHAELRSEDKQLAVCVDLSHFVIECKQGEQ